MTPRQRLPDDAPPLGPSPLAPWERRAYRARALAGKVLLVVAAGLALVTGAVVLLIAALG